MTITSDSKPLSASAIAALHQGNKVEAIKIVRMDRSLGLKEAKDIVDAYIQNNPQLETVFAENNANAKRTAKLWLSILIGIGIVVWFVLNRH